MSLTRPRQDSFTSAPVRLRVAPLVGCLLTLTARLKIHQKIAAPPALALTAAAALSQQIVSVTVGTGVPALPILIP